MPGALQRKTGRHSAVADQCRESTIITVPQGEASKSFKILETVLRQMLDFGMGRGDKNRFR